MPAKYHLKTFTMESGERYCLLSDRLTGMLAFYPTLFATVRLRNHGLSVNTMKQYISSINVLIEFCRWNDINLEDRFEVKDYLTVNEIDGLCDLCQKFIVTKYNYYSTDVYEFPLNGDCIISNYSKFCMQAGKKGYKKPPVLVARRTLYMRLTVLAMYTEWLARLIADNFDRETAHRINEMKQAILSRRPRRLGRKASSKFFDPTPKGLDAYTEDRLWEFIAIGSKENPFKSKKIQERNFLILLLMWLLGLREGELLNIQVKDINFNLNLLRVVRRADSKDDPRNEQPLVKTNPRILPLDPEVVTLLRAYIVKTRKNIPNASKFKYLFPVHKSGPTQGWPLSVSSFRKIFKTIGKVHPELSFNPHQLRHTCNDRLSEAWDSLPSDKRMTSEKEEKARNYLMGWNPDSKMGVWYSARHIRRRAYEVALADQHNRHARAVEYCKKKAVERKGF
jgi:integrase